MNPKSNQELPITLPEDERPTLPDINVDRDEGKAPGRKANRPDEDVGAVQRPPADS